MGNSALVTPALVIYRTWITGKNGERLYAKDYGRRAWRLVIRTPRKRRQS